MLQISDDILVVEIIIITKALILHVSKQPRSQGLSSSLPWTGSKGVRLKGKWRGEWEFPFLLKTLLLMCNFPINDC